MGRKPHLLSRVGALSLGAAIVILVRGVQGLTESAQQRPAAAGPAEAKQSSANPRAAAQEPGRGREADNPAEIPPLGWKDVAWRVYEEFGQDRLMLVSAGVTFYLLLATFPAIGALVSIYGLITDPVSINEHLSTLASFLPEGAVDIASETVKRITSKNDSALGFAAVTGFGIAVWGANAGMKAIFDGLNVAYDEEEKRGFVQLNLLSLAMTFGTIAAFAVTLGAVAVVPAYLEAVWLAPALEWLIWIGRWPVLLLLAMFGLAALYRFGPSRDDAQWCWLTPGALVASIGLVAFSMVFSWYVANFGSYDETYGSLGAAIGFMTWMWLSITIVMVGAELNAETEHQTTKDTTVGPPQPMGARGAQMADSLGASSD